MDVVFWLDKPPFACKGILDSFSNMWDRGIVYYSCMNDVSGIQTVINSNPTTSGRNANLLVFNSDKEAIEFANSHFDSIHLFNGYKSLTRNVLLHLAKLSKRPRIIIWGEESRISKKYRFVPYVLKFKTFKEYKYFSSISDAFLVIGKQGIRDYSKLGWPKEKLFPFFYSSVDTSKPNNTLNYHSPVKFLYLGRFDYHDKGVDTIIKAFAYLKTNNFSFTFAGGYGKDSDEIKHFIENDDRAVFHDPVPIEKCYDFFQDFDVYISPAKADSWSGPLSTALLSGIPVIASDRCGNDFLIANGKNGFVFKAGNAKKLAYLMRQFIDKKINIEEMKLNSQMSYSRIKPDNVASYLIKIIDFLYFGGERPENI